MFSVTRKVGSVVLCMLVASFGAEATDETSITRAHLAKNVILIIGDGMDDHQLTIARNYLVGARGKLSLDHLPSRSAVQVLAVDESNPERAVYVADSANSATALATGLVTSRGRVGTSAGADNDIPNLVELAAAAGLKTGIVSTASVTDASPAAFYAHISFRACENPAMMKDALIYDRLRVDCSADLKARGGLGSIAEQLISSPLDLALGGGLRHFQERAEGRDQNLLVVAEEEGFQILQSRTDLQSLATDKKILGLFAPSTLPVRLRGEGGRVAESPEPSLLNHIHWSQGDVEQPAPMRCEPEPEFAGTPSLKQMTDVALSQLSQNAERGFFLMIESASIDKKSHTREACGSIGEVAQLNEALDSALNFVASHPNTLILVTADHGQAAQLVPVESLFAGFNLPVFTPGKLIRIVTPENSILAVNYATNDIFAEEHTGVNVPLLANDQAFGLVPSMLTQSEIFDAIKTYLAL